MERYLLTGANGQLGRELHRQLDPQGKSLPKSKEVLDITDRTQLKEWLPVLKPELIINTAAYTVTFNKDYLCRRQCWKVNVEGVDNLAKVCSADDIPLIHISSDFVFGVDDTRKSPYLENDPIGPCGFYGQSKAMGE